MPRTIIETFNLTKIYRLKGKKKEIVALNNANIEVKEGEIFGLLGPNGAGKTTMVQLLTTLIQPTSGYAIVDGFNIINNPSAIKDRFSLMLGKGMIYFRITGYDNLKFFCQVYNIQDFKKKIYEIAKEFNLDQWLNQRVETYSLGMKVKLALCRALLIDRPILFLDEPTLSVDISTTLHIIDKLKKLDKTIFLTSHNMHVIERLCNRIAFIDKGKILKIGTQEELKKLMQFEVKIEITVKNDKDKLKKELNQQNFIKNISKNNDNLVITLSNKKFYKDLFLILSRYDILKIKELELALDDIFLQVI